MPPEKELSDSDKSVLAQALIWPAMDVGHSQQSRPAGSLLAGLTSAARETAQYASLLEDTYARFPNKAPIADLVRSLRPMVQSQALHQQLQPGRAPIEQRYAAVAALLDTHLAPEQAGAFKELMLAVGRAAAGAAVEGPEADLLRRMAAALRLGPAGRQGTISTAKAEDEDVIEATRRRPAGSTPAGDRPTAQRPQRRR